MTPTQPQPITQHKVEELLELLELHRQDDTEIAANAPSEAETLFFTGKVRGLEEAIDLVKQLREESPSLVLSRNLVKQQREAE